MRPESASSMSTLATQVVVASRRLRAIRARLVGRSGFDDLPASEKTGEPETLAHLPAFFEPEQLDRVIACGFGRDRAEELVKLRDPTFVGTPAERYRLGDSIIIGGTIITRQSRHILRLMPELRHLMSTLSVYDRATLSNSQQGLYYFGHWLRDDCTLHELIKDEPNLLSIARPDWPDRHYYEAGFGQSWKETSFAQVGDLTLWRDMSYSADKARRLHGLRAKLRKAVAGRGAGKIIYISRGQQGEPRNMSNTTAFEAAMHAAGIETVDPGNVGAAILDARMIIAIEGSHACHGVYALAEGGSFLILQPPERFYNPLRNWASLLGLNYGIVIGQKDPTSFTINPDEVLRMVDRLLAVPSATAGSS